MTRPLPLWLAELILVAGVAAGAVGAWLLQ